jgi:hypothetical protein
MSEGKVEVPPELLPTLRRVALKMGITEQQLVEQALWEFQKAHPVDPIWLAWDGTSASA